MNNVESILYQDFSNFIFHLDAESDAKLILNSVNLVLPSAPPLDDYQSSAVNYGDYKFIKQAIHEQTKNLLVETNEIASSIFGRAQASTYQPTSRKRNAAAEGIATSAPSFTYINMFNTTKTTHHHHAASTFGPINAKKVRKEDDELSNGNRMLIGVIGALVIGIVSFGLGAVFAKKAETDRKITELKNLKTDWQKNKKEYPADYQTLVDNVTKKAQSLLAHQRKNHYRNIALLIGGLIVGGLLIGAAVTANPALLIAGAVGGVVVGAFALAKLGHSYFNQQEKHVANAIVKDFTQINKIEANNIIIA